MKHANLKALFTAIANSIRNKTGGTDPIIADDFPEAIDGIQTGGGVDKIQLLIEGKQNSAVNLFYNFGGDSVDALLEGVDTSAITSMEGMFFRCNKIRSVPFLDTSNVTAMNNMFYFCTLLESVPLFDTGNVTNMGYMFQNCTALTSVPLFDTSNVTIIESMFNGCTSLKSVPLFDTKNIKAAMYAMFNGCTALTSVPLFDTSNVTAMNTMFQNCTSLKSVPLFDTSKVTNMSYMFNGCTALTSVPAFDMRKVTSTSSIFTNCSALTECLVRNIGTNLQVGYGTSYGHLLTLESLLSLCKECRDMSSARTLTIGTANLAKLEGVYVKLIDITDEMRTEDDLIDKKYPFVQCESTDEGAMPIADYMTTKKWTLK